MKHYLVTTKEGNTGVVPEKALSFLAPSRVASFVQVDSEGNHHPKSLPEHPLRVFRVGDPVRKDQALDNFARAFCYPRGQKPYILEGSYREIKRLLRNKRTATLVHLRQYPSKLNWINSYWVFLGRFAKPGAYATISEHRFSPKKVPDGWLVTSYLGTKHLLAQKVVRRVRRRWMKELDQLLLPRTS